MAFKRSQLHTLFSAVVLLAASNPIQAQEVEPGVGIWGTLEIGRSYAKQVQKFAERNAGRTPEAYGIYVSGQERGIVTSIEFRAPSFFTLVAGIRVQIGMPFRLDNIGDTQGILNFPDLGLRIRISDNRTVMSITVYRPLTNP